MSANPVSMLEIINAPCGDVLKAHLLNALHGMSINLISVRAPTGAVEQAFGVSRAKMIEEAPPRSADAIMEEFKKDHARPRPEAIETLPKMPETIRFEDEVPHRDRKAAIVVSLPQREEEPQLAPGEYRIEGKVYVSIVRAADLRGTSNLKTIVATATMKGWERVRMPEDKRQPLYLKDDVTAPRGFTRKPSQAA